MTIAGKVTKKFLDSLDESDVRKLYGATALGAALASQDAEAMFIGKTAKTFNDKALELAQKMKKEGYSDQDIWRETADRYGSPTFKDSVDDQWKQEIGDVDMAVNPEVFDPRFLPLANEDTLLRVSDLIKHEALFDAYPHLRETRFVNVPEYSPYFDATNDTINHPLRSQKSAFTAAEEENFLSSMSHELQHAIQETEDFARGGNPSVEFMNDLSRQLKTSRNTARKDYSIVGLAKSKNTAYKHIEHELRAIKKSTPKWVAKRKLKKIIKDTQDKFAPDLVNEQNTLNFLYRYPETSIPEMKKDLSDKAESLFNRRFKGDDITVETEPVTHPSYPGYKKYQDLDRKFGTLATLTDFEKYKRLSGEVEARNIQERRKYTDEERYQKHPEITADRPPNQRLPVYHGKSDKVPKTKKQRLQARNERRKRKQREKEAKQALYASIMAPPANRVEGAQVNWAGTLAELIREADKRTDKTVANLYVPKGLENWLRKLQYGDEITWWDRFWANPTLG